MDKKDLPPRVPAAASLPPALHRRLLDSMSAAATEAREDRLLEQSLVRRYSPMPLPAGFKERLQKEIARVVEEECIASRWPFPGRSFRHVAALAAGIVFFCMAGVLIYIGLSTNGQSEAMAQNTPRLPAASAYALIDRTVIEESSRGQRSGGNGNVSSVCQRHVIYQDSITIRREGFPKLVIRVPHREIVNPADEVI